MYRGAGEGREGGGGEEGMKGEEGGYGQKRAGAHSHTHTHTHTHTHRPESVGWLPRRYTELCVVWLYFLFQPHWYICA